MSGRVVGQPADALRGEREAFGDRVERLMPDLLRYFARRVTPRDDAYDCVSEALVVLWRRRVIAPTSDGEFRAWAFGVSRRVLLNHARTARRQARLLAKMSQETDVVDSAFGERTLVSDALATLPAADRELVTLVVWDGFGVAEAGAVLGLRPVTARSRYSRARARLRDIVGSAEGNL